MSGLRFNMTGFKRATCITVVLLISVLLSASILSGCKQATQSGKQNVAEQIQVPAFVADSAYQYIQTQVDFGPRVPNTEAHLQCAAYLSAKLKSFGAEVTEQKAELKAFNGTVLNAVNVIGSFQPERQKRILLFAHWDSRPWLCREGTLPAR